MILHFNQYLMLKWEKYIGCNNNKSGEEEIEQKL